MAVDFIRIIRDDMTLFHDGPVGVLEQIRSWGSGFNYPEATTRPSGWTHYVMWAHFTRDATGALAPLSSADAARPWRDPRPRIGNNAPNTRQHIRHHQMHWLLANGTWITTDYRDSANDRLYPYNWSESGEIGMPTSNYTAAHPGGGSSMRAVGLANDPRNPASPNQYRERIWHPYGSRNPVPSNYVGWVTCLFSRLIVDNPALPDDRAQCNIVGGNAFDWYISANPGSLVQTSSPSTSTVWYGGFSRFKYLTNDWQMFAQTNLSETQLRANPPPIVGLDLLETTTSPPPPTAATNSFYLQLTALDRASPAGATRTLQLPSPPRAGATVLAHGSVWRFGNLPSVITRVYDHIGNLRLEQRESGNDDNVFSFCAIREGATPPPGGASYSITVEFAQPDFNRIAWNVGELREGMTLTQVVKAASGDGATATQVTSGALTPPRQVLIGVGAGQFTSVDVLSDSSPAPPPPPDPPPVSTGIQAQFNAMTVQGRGYQNLPSTVPVGTRPAWPVMKNRTSPTWNQEAGGTIVLWAPNNPLEGREFFKYIYGQGVGRDRGWIKPWYVIGEELDWKQKAFSKTNNNDGAVLVPANNQVATFIDKWRHVALFRKGGVLAWEACWGTGNSTNYPARYNYWFNDLGLSNSDRFTSTLRPGVLGVRLYNGTGATGPGTTAIIHGTGDNSRALFVSEMGWGNDDNGLLAIASRCEAWIEAIPGQPASAVNDAMLLLNLGADMYPQVSPGDTSPGSKDIDITTNNGFEWFEADSNVKNAGHLLGDWARLTGTPQSVIALAYPRVKGAAWMASVPPLPSWFTA